LPWLYSSYCIVILLLPDHSERSEEPMNLACSERNAQGVHFAQMTGYFMFKQNGGAVSRLPLSLHLPGFARPDEAERSVAYAHYQAIEIAGFRHIQ
jgi:hypothetical protein